jgi:hypothetical protein
MNQHPAFRQSRALRDLHWALHSPSLIKQPEGAIEPSLLPDLDQVDVAELEAFLIPHARFRIGEYFEGLILFWLERIRKVQLLAQHQQVFEQEQTVGEIDFLFTDEAGVVTHWETAVKFYLYCPAENPTGSHWIGPNVKDTFQKKMRRLFEHQLPLSRKHFPQVTRRQAYVKGIIFYHPDQELSAQLPPDLPDRLSPTHARGTWIRFSELTHFQAQYGEPRFLIREKPDWLSPSFCSSTNPALIDFAALHHRLETHFQQSPRPILISLLTSQQLLYQEAERVFIVPDHWPHIL